MIQVRDVLQVKFGNIDQAVELFTRSTTPLLSYMTPEYHFNVLTDISGSMYTLVNEFLVPSIGRFESILEQSFNQPGFEEWFRQFQLFIEDGRREFYTVEGQYSSWSRPGQIVVRECYRAYKWQIRSAVPLLQRYGAMLEAHGVGQRPRVLTDASGPMFQAIIELETDSMSTWESQRRLVFREPEFRVWFLQLLTTVDSGAHDFCKVEYTGA
ncbi:MAG: hypothetical protein ACM3PY_10545 [Omnitrophica WOR_2 bacterium]